MVSRTIFFLRFQWLLFVCSQVICDLLRIVKSLPLFWRSSSTAGNLPEEHSMQNTLDMEVRGRTFRLRLRGFYLPKF